MNWVTTNLGDFAPFVYGKSLPKRSRATDGHVDVFGSGGVDGKHDEALTNGPTVIVGRKGTVGKVYFSPTPCWPIDTTYFVEDEDLVLARFKYYALQTLGLDGLNYDSAVPGLKRDQAHSIQLRVPSADVQRHVATALGTLDDLIENNRRRIEVLEEMARLLYREWFVHFRFPGHEDVELTDSDLGLTPEGWATTTLGKAARWLSGGTPNTREPVYWNGEIPWITSGTLTSFLLDDSERKLTKLGVENGSRIVEKDTTLFVVRGMSLAKEFRHGIANVPVAFGQDCKALLAKPGVEPLFLAFSVSSLADKIQSMVEFAAHGTGKLSTDRIQALAIPCPPERVQRLFVASVAPMRELMSNLRRQNRVLREAHELLLPRLVSGELDVSELDLELETLEV